MPLVHMPGSERDATERQRKARKVKPQYTEGRLVKVARAGSQPEAELVEALLLEEGIPSMSRRSGGFDVPDFLAAGPRDIPAAGAATTVSPSVSPSGGETTSRGASISTEGRSSSASGTFHWNASRRPVTGETGSQCSDT